MPLLQSATGRCHARRETPGVDMQTWFVRAQSGRTRVLTAAAVGAGAALVAAWFAPWQLTVLVGWDVMALTVVVSVWTRGRPVHSRADRGVRPARGRHACPAPTSCSWARRW